MNEADENQRSGAGASTTAPSPAEPAAESRGAHAPASATVTPADSALPVWLTSLPGWARPYAALSRWDRPVGIWLLALPTAMGLAFTRIFQNGLMLVDVFWLAAFFIGAVAMRGAGCTWNDITDRDIDAGVARTAARPLPSGQVSVTQAYLWLAGQLAVAFLIWLALPLDAKIVALLALPLVGAYPFMKRITWWPQAWLGATMNWGVFVGAATAGSVTPASVVLWLGLATWTIAYDTIYALQDREDDELMGVKSTARLFGEHAVLGAFIFHMIAAGLIALAMLSAGAPTLAGLTGLAFLGHGIWQLTQLRASREREALGVFKSNVWAGAIILAGIALAALLA